MGPGTHTQSETEEQKIARLLNQTSDLDATQQLVDIGKQHYVRAEARNHSGAKALTEYVQHLHDLADQRAAMGDKGAAIKLLAVQSVLPGFDDSAHWYNSKTDDHFVTPAKLELAKYQYAKTYGALSQRGAANGTPPVPASHKALDNGADVVAAADVKSKAALNGQLLFDTNKYAWDSLTADQQKNFTTYVQGLLKQAKTVDGKSVLQITIDGYADGVGRKEANQTLSERRAHMAWTQMQKIASDSGVVLEHAESGHGSEEAAANRHDPNSRDVKISVAVPNANATILASTDVGVGDYRVVAPVLPDNQGSVLKSGGGVVPLFNGVKVAGAPVALETISITKDAKGDTYSIGVYEKDAVIGRDDPRNIGTGELKAKIHGFTADQIKSLTAQLSVDDLEVRTAARIALAGRIVDARQHDVANATEFYQQGYATKDGAIAHVYGAPAHKSGHASQATLKTTDASGVAADPVAAAVSPAVQQTQVPGVASAVVKPAPVAGTIPVNNGTQAFVFQTDPSSGTGKIEFGAYNAKTHSWGGGGVVGAAYPLDEMKNKIDLIKNGSTADRQGLVDELNNKSQAAVKTPGSGTGRSMMATTLGAPSMAASPRPPSMLGV